MTKSELKSKLQKKFLSLKSVLYFLILFAFTSCGDSKYSEERRRENFNKNYEIFHKLEEMQRENISVFAIGVHDYTSFKTPKGLEEAIANGYSYKQHNIDRTQYSLGHNRSGSVPLEYQFIREVGLSDKRWNEYKMLLRQANLDLLIYTYDRPDKRQVSFWENTNSDFGYVYMEFPPSRVCKTFKNCQSIMPSQTSFVYLRKNWYLFNEKFRLEQD